MTLREKLKELNASDGPNIPQRTLAAYTGMYQPALCKFMQGKKELTDETQKKIEKGLKELGQEIWGIVNSKD